MIAHVIVLLAAIGIWCGCTRTPTIPTAPTPADVALASLIVTSRQHVAAAPRSAEAWGRLGQAFHAAELPTQARTCYGHAMQLDPKSARWPHLLGLLLVQDSPVEALTNFARAAKLERPFPGASRYQAGRMLLERGQLNEAQRHLETVAACVPGHGAAHLDLARIHATRGSNDVAFNLLQTAKTNSVTARAALLLLAQIRHRQGDAEEAEDYARQAERLPRLEWQDPYFVEVQSLREDQQAIEDRVNRLLTQGKTGEAEHALWPLMQRAPDAPETLLLLARVRYQQRECVVAEQTLRRHLAMSPESLNGLIQLGLALLCQEKWSDAIEPLRRAVALKPDYAQAHFNLGFALSRQGDSAGAIESLQNALRCNPGDPIIHDVLGEELRKTGRMAESEEHTGRAAKLRGNTR
jgi:tetratricopeptide (TPR) repeat protein